jgi:biopolymer transport protein ExbB/TolQ
MIKKILFVFCGIISLFLTCITFYVSGNILFMLFIILIPISWLLIILPFVKDEKEQNKRIYNFKRKETDLSKQLEMAVDSYVLEQCKAIESFLNENDIEMEDYLTYGRKESFQDGSQKFYYKDILFLWCYFDKEAIIIKRMK